MNGSEGESPKTRKSILKSLAGGPHGVGDPNDQTLRKVEKDILIPKKVRERIEKEKCVEEVNDFLNCSKEYGLLNVIKCRKESGIMKECYQRWFYDKELIDDCTKEYLYERTYFRQHGVPTENVKKTLRFNVNNVNYNKT